MPESNSLTLGIFVINIYKQDSGDVHFMFIKVYNQKKQFRGGKIMEIRGEDLRQARKKAGLTQEKVADETEFSQRQISRFERNENLGKLNKYFKLFMMLYSDDKDDEK